MIASQQPAWNVEFWMPVLLPTMGSLIELAILDRDRLTSELVGKIVISVDEILTGSAAATIRWHQLYSKPKAGVLARAKRRVRSTVLGQLHSSSTTCSTTSSASASSEWRGSVLLRLALAKPDDRKAQLPERVMQRRLQAVQEPPYTVYALQVAVVGGAIASEAANGQQVHVEAVLGEHLYRSERVVVARGFFNLPEPGGGGDVGRGSGAGRATSAGWLLRKQMEHEPLELPSDVDQVADVILYLCDKAGKRTHFRRFRSHELAAESRRPTAAPAWITLSPVDPKPVTRGEPLPSLFCRVRLATEQEARGWSAIPVPPSSPLRAWELRLHLFQARDLPASDPDGVLDAFAVVSIGTQLATGVKGKLRSDIAADTAHPQWYETMRLQAWLPQPFESAPNLVLELWDHGAPPLPKT